MRSIVRILVPFLMFLALRSSATPQIRTATFTKKDITFTLEMTGVDHVPRDTVSAILRCRNNSSHQIIIFDPALLYANKGRQPTFQAKGCDVVFEMGGEWQYELGYEQLVALCTIAPSSEREWLLRFELPSEEECKPCVLYSQGDTNISRVLVSVSMGFIEDISKYGLQEVENSGWYKFTNERKGMEFGTYLSRQELGPIAIKIQLPK